MIRRLGRWSQADARFQVDVIGHPAIGNDLPAASVNRGNQFCGESLGVPFVVKQFPTSGTNRDDMVDHVFVLKSWRARHRLFLQAD